MAIYFDNSDVTIGNRGPQGKQGIRGDKGEPGHTPIRGTDYWTAADQASIVDDILATLPTWEGGSY